ncbi:hypothetical protein PsYK624_103230 [Phanerochaete sordida]|uniref:Uncharacterized protein n=1 Tax=Phanerochaete sordida TaxID=48140 RepID=A0A9P3GIA3_9APHY|nr:hypothetical protein PsYK624_103230 [Phanerochaete sordida]
MSVEGFPSWIQDLYPRTRKMDVGAKDRGEWEALVDDWLRLEVALGFDGESPRLGTKGRPPAVGAWIKNARAKTVTDWMKKAAEKAKTPIDKKKYAEQFAQWWDGLNPDWRERVDGRLVTGGEGNWDSLIVPGVNGLINVLAGLEGLHTTADDAEWLWQLRDVRWAMSEMRKAVTPSGTKRAASSDDDHEASAPHPKRIRKAGGAAAAA